MVVALVKVAEVMREPLAEAEVAQEQLVVMPLMQLREPVATQITMTLHKETL